MKIKSIVFVSNCLSLHQKYICDAFFSQLNGNFRFIETEPISQERLKLGWKKLEANYLIRTYESLSSYQKAMVVISDADVVIFASGSAKESFIKERKKAKKLIFRYSERPIKTGKNNVVKNFLRGLRYQYRNPRHLPIYMLCASAYTPSDFTKLGVFNNRFYKWGYFPEVKQYEDIDGLLFNKEYSTFLWAARFIELKNLPDVLKAFSLVLLNHPKAKLKIIGGGPLENSYHSLVKEMRLENNVFFLGTMSSLDVRLEMEKAGTFILSSGFEEGWGAVVNEAMNSGCVVIGSHSCGSVPFLIEEGKTGLIYKLHDVEELARKMEWSLESASRSSNIGRNAYLKIINIWEPKKAAARFIALAEEIIEGKYAEDECNLFSEGPCSPAKILDDWWITNSSDKEK